MGGHGGRGGGGTGNFFQDIIYDLTRRASKGCHDVKIASADTPLTLTDACAAGVGVAIEDTHNHSQRR